MDMTQEPNLRGKADNYNPLTPFVGGVDTRRRFREVLKIETENDVKASLAVQQVTRSLRISFPDGRASKVWPVPKP